MAENNKDDIENNPPDDENRQVPDRRPDLGIDNVAGRVSPVAESPPVPEATLRREENPFSFKKFLNQDLGARRKEYPVDIGHSSHNAPIHVNPPEMSSMLPDFVQDHLVVEQCYLSSSAHQGPLPFDLPLPADDRPEPSGAMRLPDFLSDGPIHSHRNDNESHNFPEPPHLNGHASPTPLPRNELDRLQREVDNLRRQLHERNRRIQILESEVDLLHSRDARETDSLEYALQQVEANLRQTSKRAMAAEQQVSKLKAENNALKSRLKVLDNAAAGPSTSYDSRSRNQRLAQDLRSAAAAAELHLGSLMSGIDNLKLLAASLEEKPEYDLDDASSGSSGPAL